MEKRSNLFQGLYESNERRKKMEANAEFVTWLRWLRWLVACDMTLDYSIDANRLNIDLVKR